MSKTGARQLKDKIDEYKRLKKWIHLKLADFFDGKGMRKRADYIDKIIYKLKR